MIQHKTTCGFTLIEILITLVIVSVGVLALGNFTISMIGNGQLARERLTAVHLAEQVIEFWQQDGNDYLPAIASSDCSMTTATAAPKYPVKAICTPSSGSGISYTIVANHTQASGPLPGTTVSTGKFTSQSNVNTPFTKAVTVSWTHRGNTHSTHLTHMSEVK